MCAYVKLEPKQQTDKRIISSSPNSIKFSSEVTVMAMLS